MQHTIKALIAAASALAASSMLTMSALAQTTGPGDRALVNMAMDRNYNCARSDAGTCLPDMAPQMPDIPLMPSAGEGGASVADRAANRETDRANIPITSAAPDVSAGYVEPDDNWIFVAISGVCIVGIVILVRQFIRQKSSP